MKRKRLLPGLLGYLNLNDIGIIELVFALSLMLSGFLLWSFPLSVGIWIVLLAIIFVRGNFLRIRFYRPLLLFVVYWIIHTIFILFVGNVNLFAIIEQIVFFLSIFIVSPTLNLSKLRGALNWVALISIAGLLYQWSMILTGEMVHQLEIPGLSLSINSLEKISLRPSSFFQEPAAYVAFMMCPLAFSLIDRKYFWSIVIIFSIFLTTSTTGIFVSFIMLFVSLLNQRTFSKKTVFIIGLIIAVSYFSLTRLEVFEYGIKKIENTDAESNVRLSQGPYVVSTMESSDYIFGVPYSSAFNYCKAGHAPEVVYYGDSVYLSSFWQILLLYGVLGLVLYINVYFRLFRECKETWPLVVSLCVLLFSSGYGVGAFYTFTMIVLLSLLYNNQSRALQKTR